MFAVVDAAGKVVQSGRRDVPAVTDGDAYRIALAVPLDPGTYRVRFAVADGAGHIGSLQQVVTAQLKRFGPFGVSDLFLSWSAVGGSSRFLALDALPAAATALRASIEMYPDRENIEASAITVRFVLRRSDQAAPVATRDVVPRAASGALVSSATLSTAALTPGTYVIDVQLIHAGVVLGTATSVFRKGA